MDKLTYCRQVNTGLRHVIRWITTYGMLLSVVQLTVVVLMFVILYLYPQELPYYFAIALPVSIAVAVIFIIAMGKTFKRYAPPCSSCHKPIGVFNKRRAIATGLCPYCQATLFES